MLKNEKAEMLASSSSTSNTSINYLQQSTGNKFPMGRYFLYMTDANNMKCGKCLLCEKEKRVKKFIKMKNSNTTGLKKHLLAHHRKVYNEVYRLRNPATQVITEPVQPREVKTRRTAMTHFELCDLVIDWLCFKCLPLNFFEDDETREFFKKINDKIIMPSEDTLKTSIIEKFDKIQNNFKMILMQNESKVSFTIDGWTSIEDKTFYKITAHFIDANWEPRSVVLDFIPFNGKQTGEDIAVAFYNLLKLFHIDNKCIGIMVDSSVADTKFMETLQVFMQENCMFLDMKEQYLHCFANILNSGIQHALKLLKLEKLIYNSENIEEQNIDQETDEIIGQLCLKKLREILKKVRTSEQWQNELRCCCENVNIQYDMPNNDVSSCWNVTHDLIKTGINLKYPINMLCDNNISFYQFKLNEDEWNLLERFYKYFKGFHTVSTLLGDNNYTTLPMAIVGFNMLLVSIEKQISELNNKSDRNKIDESLLNAFQSGRDKMLKLYPKTNWVYSASLILDPRHKVTTFDLTSWGKEMKAEAVKNFFEVYKNYYTEEQYFDYETREINLQDGDIDIDSLYMEDKICTPTQEYETYTTAPRVPKETSILNWWKENANKYPTLSRMARDLFAITATSMPVDKLFFETSLVTRKHGNIQKNDPLARTILIINSWFTNGFQPSELSTEMPMNPMNIFFIKTEVSA